MAEPFDFNAFTQIGGGGNDVQRPTFDIANIGQAPVDSVLKTAVSPDPSTLSYGLLGATGVNGETTQFGLLNPALSAIGGGLNIYQGLKQLGQQEDALDFQKESFGKNFAASKAAFQERLRGNFGRKATLGGNKGTTEDQYVNDRSDF